MCVHSDCTVSRPRARLTAHERRDDAACMPHAATKCNCSSTPTRRHQKAVRLSAPGSSRTGSDLSARAWCASTPARRARGRRPARGTRQTKRDASARARRRAQAQGEQQQQQQRVWSGGMRAWRTSWHTPLIHVASSLGRVGAASTSVASLTSSKCSSMRFRKCCAPEVACRVHVHKTLCAGAR